MYENDNRTVLTLDAGGTNFVFTAIKGCKEITTPVRLDAVTDNLNGCLTQIAKGFEMVTEQLSESPAAISFAFPGPADYKAGIIGDLPNFKCFRGGVALGPYLKNRFNLPVYINNDGNLFALGEAMAGVLPRINKALEDAGSSKRYRNLIGITLGTGFGCGVSINGELLTGDNGCGGDVWLMRNKKYPELIAEESVSIRAVKRVYSELSGNKSELSPKEIFEIVEGLKEGNTNAAKESFRELGEIAADAITRALDIADGIVVIGGGISAAYKYIIPGIMEEMRRTVGTFSGASFPCLQMEVFNLEEKEGLKEFLKEDSTLVEVPMSEMKVLYSNRKKSGIAISSLGTSKAVSIGAYAYALNAIDNRQ